MIILLDTETTSKDSPRAVEAAVAVIDDASTMKISKAYSERYKPPVDIDYGAMAVHRITNEMVAGCPAFMDGDIARVIAENNDPVNVLVAHNAPFDVSVIKNEGIDIKMRVIDTHKCCKIAFLDKPGVGLSLSSLWAYLKLYNEPMPDAMQGMAENPHSAAGDVAVLYHLFLRMCSKYPVTEMINMTERPILYRVMPFGKFVGQSIKDVVIKDKGYINWALHQKKMEDEDVLYSIKYWIKVDSNEQAQKKSNSSGEQTINLGE